MSKETKELFRLFNGKFNDNVLREIILASEGLKASRTCLDEADLDFFLTIAKSNGLKVVVSKEKYLHRKDVGKGGWSNSIESIANIDNPDGLYNVYFAVDKLLAEKGSYFEDNSDQRAFGSLLGIPACCIKSYLRFHPIAAIKQNDFVPLILEDTAGDMPYNFWNNYVSQYFDRSLLSFFPCSFNCQNAATVAKKIFSVLQECDAAWAEGFIKAQRTNILYTEYLGLHRLIGVYRDGWLTYNSYLVESTELTWVRKEIDKGNRLRIQDKHKVEIYQDTMLVSEIIGEDVSVCIFN